MTKQRSPLNTDELLDNLSGAVGERIRLDADGRCLLMFAGGVEIALEFISAMQILTFRSEVLRSGAHGHATLWAALAMNYGRLSSGICMALDPLSGWLMLYGALPLDASTGDQVMTLVSDMVEQTRSSREEFQRTAHGSTTIAPPSAPSTPVNGSASSRLLLNPLIGKL